MTDQNIIVLGSIPKSLNQVFHALDIKTKRFLKLGSLTDYILDNSVDICILPDDKITEEELFVLHDSSPDTAFIILGDSTPQRIYKGIYFLSVTDIDNKHLIHRFLHNLFNFIRQLRRREELTAMLLHDTRSPLNSMIGYVELLENGVFGPLNKGQQQILSNIMLLGDMIIELVEDINLLHQFEQRQFQIQVSPFDLIKVLDECLVALWIQADKKDIHIRKSVEPDLPKILGDSGRIQRVIMNLITNAIKFSPEKSTIEIDITTKSDEMVQISISDNGIGINEDDIPKIFEKYYSVDKKSEGKKGFGLGLYISKNIVEAHGGKIWVENNEKGGCTFLFTLPIAGK